MAGPSKKGLTTRAEDYSQWYLDVIEMAQLAENSPVRGCMVIKPYGYAIWENMQKVLDAKFKETGVENAYFPLFIPKSFLSKEASHVEGFAKECAVVTHYRLKNAPDGSGVIVDPEAKLEEELIVRPTSETIIWSVYKNWIQSYRDLPLVINQWCNIVRWEMRTRLFLRTAEFLWQEGHTAHATSEDAEERVKMMLEVYRSFVEDYMAVPVIPGRKSESEKFAGADHTYCIEAMMQDGKALQAGTSHHLGQNFGNAFDVKFVDKEGKQQGVWGTSWGSSTRLIGALIMTHSDDDGLVLPPNIAPIKIVIVPIWKTDEEKEKILAATQRLKLDLAGVDAWLKIDDRDYQSPGYKFNEWEKKGVPIRLEIGPKDLEKEQVVIVRRDTKEKMFVPMVGLADACKKLLAEMQISLYERAKKFREDHSKEINDYDEFKKLIEENPGFFHAHWCGQASCEDQIKQETKATIRCIPFDGLTEEGKCMKCGGDSKQRVIFAKAY